MTDLPASNASPLELELARLSDRIEAIDGEHLMATAWNAAACPPELLPILAWSLSVDVWDDRWPADVKRTAVEQSPAYHESKGTVRAIQDALKLLGCRTVVTDWWQAAPQRRRGTFKVTAFVTERREAGAPLISEALMRQAFQSVAMAKPKSRAFTIELAAGFSAGAGLSAAAEALQIACAAGPAAPFTLIGRGAGLAAALQAAQISRCKASAAPDLKPTGVGGLASAIAACQIARLNVELSVS